MLVPITITMTRYVEWNWQETIATITAAKRLFLTLVPITITMTRYVEWNWQKTIAAITAAKFRVSPWLSPSRGHLSSKPLSEIIRKCFWDATSSYLVLANNFDTSSQLENFFRPQWIQCWVHQSNKNNIKTHHNTNVIDISRILRAERNVGVQQLVDFFFHQFLSIRMSINFYPNSNCLH